MFLTALVSADRTILQPPGPVPFEDRAAEPDEVGFMSSLACRTGFGPLGLRSTDDGLRLILKSRGIPIRFVVACLMIPSSGFVAVFVKEFFWDGRFQPVLALALLMIPFIIADVVGFVGHLNRRAGDGKVRLTFDRAASMVELPDFGLMIPSKAIQRWILVEGFQSKKDKHETNSTWVAELSLVAQGDWNGLRRIHVISVGSPRVRKIAERLAVETHAPLTCCRSSLEMNESLESRSDGMH